MEMKKDCEHGVDDECTHPEMGGGVKDHRSWFCTICEYFLPKKKKE